MNELINVLLKDTSNITYRGNRKQKETCHCDHIGVQLDTAKWH